MYFKWVGYCLISSPDIPINIQCLHLILKYIVINTDTRSKSTGVNKLNYISLRTNIKFVKFGSIVRSHKLG